MPSYSGLTLALLDFDKQIVDVVMRLCVLAGFNQHTYVCVLELGELNNALATL